MDKSEGQKQALLKEIQKLQEQEFHMAAQEKRDQEEFEAQFNHNQQMIAKLGALLQDKEG